MSEQTQNNNQQTIVIGLIVIAALLAAIVGVLVYQGNQAASVPPPNAVTQGTDPQGTASDAAAETPATPVDPKSATKVPKGTEPEAFVTAYYEACDKGDWKAAFDALPADKKAGNSPDALKEQVTGYGVKSFKVTSAKTEGDTSIVKVDQVTGGYGTFENTWTLVKKDGVWLVQSKAVTGMK